VARLIGQSEEEAERLAAAWYHAIYAYDELLLSKGVDWRGTPQDNLWAWFWNRMAEAAGTPPVSDEAAARIVAENRRRNLWTAVNPDSHSVLEHLHGRYRLGVVSNSDGTVAATFAKLGLDRWFQVIVDSEVVGVAKPDPAIFRHALEPLGSVPERTVFIGDSYALDVRGAQRAGIRPILLDPHGLHAKRDVQRIARLSELSTLFS
jgi:HAD superfamily hydrolase (TIGR01509 family)